VTFSVEIDGKDFFEITERNAMSDSVGYDEVPDVLDGLLKKERAILYCLQQAQQELGDRNVPTIMLYGRVLELIDISREEFQTILSRFVGLTRLPGDR
jgi:hypothetical protein